MPADFADLGPRDAVDQVLHRLVRAGALRRITRSHKPNLNALTGNSTHPDPRSVIDALARRDYARMIVDGLLPPMMLDYPPHFEYCNTLGRRLPCQFTHELIIKSNWRLCPQCGQSVIASAPIVSWLREKPRVTQICGFILQQSFRDGEA